MRNVRVSDELHGKMKRLRRKLSDDQGTDLSLGGVVQRLYDEYTKTDEYRRLMHA